MLFCFLILKNLEKKSFHNHVNWNFLNVLHEVKISILHENDLYHLQISIYVFMSSVELKPACLSEVLDCIVPYIIQTKQYNVIVLLRR